MSEINQKILIADDEPAIREIVRILLRSEGYDVIEAADGAEAVHRSADDIVLYILDIMMPTLSGIQACVEIRKHYNAPVLFLTAKGRESDKTVGFSAGGDDYLVKPFSNNELLTRVKALIRRYLVYNDTVGTAASSKLVIGELVINTDAMVVAVYGEEKQLTPTEYKILLLMAKNPKKIFSAKNIYESVWGEPYFYTANNTVMVHIRKLREKIERDTSNPEFLQTVWGKGYKIG